MARIQHMAVALPKSVQVMSADGQVEVKSGKNVLSLALPAGVGVTAKDGAVHVTVASSVANPAIGGTVRAHINNMVQGVTKGFEERLTLVGVGYRAQAQGKKLNLSLGFSHPIEYTIPAGVQIETPSQTEIVIKGADRHLVGQTAANVRAFRPPEPYKGKGVRYVGEHIVMKEAKKK
ncbi:MAG TPA: 50S ribosomal protein L6 [Nevskiaceae bacterium]|nr:50S ribosomal protein L6 [Nevskiaceae bacterium]